MKANFAALSIILITLSIITLITNYALTIAQTQYLDIPFFLTVTTSPVLIVGLALSVMIYDKVKFN